MNIYFDLDGTLADFYSVDNWLQKILENDSSPYREARPLHNFSYLAKLMHKCQEKGIEFSIISWGSKNSTENFLSAVADEKRKWLKTHLPSVNFSQIIIVPYGTPKENYKNSHFDILFDDEQANRKNWKNGAFEPQYIIPILKLLAK